MDKISDVVKPGVVTGKDLQYIFKAAKANGFAIPAVNVVGSSTVNAVMEAAKAVNAPVMIQFSNGGAAFNAGKGLKLEGQQAAILGAIAGAKHIHILAEAYGVLSSIPTMLQRNCFPGSTVFLMRAKSIMQKPANHFTAPICWIFQKSLLKRI
jgi:hypothetical protein